MSNAIYDFPSKKEFELHVAVTLSAMLPYWYSLHKADTKIVKQVALSLRNWFASAPDEETRRWRRREVEELDSFYRTYKETGKTPDVDFSWPDTRVMLWSAMRSAMPSTINN